MKTLPLKYPLKKGFGSSLCIATKNAGRNKVTEKSVNLYRKNVSYS